MKDYNHGEIEKKWQSFWQENGTYTTPDQIVGKDNYYVLCEFPYPSGNLHVGHWYAFAVTDIYARYYRMLGFNVLFPFGFDAFGLPAENAAIKRNLNPRDWTYENMDYMRNQLKSMGAMFDWSREIVTCDPKYYKWTQWLFLQMYKKGLAEQKETPANWCPSCKTVLANEQVVSGHCERCGIAVEQKNMNQWSIKITEYSDRLIDDLETLDWPEEIKTSQKNWIGRSSGAEIPFTIFDSDGKVNESVNVFTTRPDTLFGVTYLVFAPEHKIVQQIKDSISNWSEVDEYIKTTAKKNDRDRMIDQKEKTGVKLDGIFATNPANDEKIPVYIADYVLAHYGTGIVMAVPAHDERDMEFATKFNLPVKDAPFTTELFGGKETKTYKLRDWGVSRQRYWGCPIPIIHCPDCGPVAVPDDQLPVILPDVADYLPRDDGKSPLAKATEWMNVPCPTCGKPAERETDTFDTFMDSSWYFLRYLDPKNDTAFADAQKISNWMPVDFYSGGAEHTTMHLLYSRFFQKALFDLGLVSDNEPYKVRLNRGLILGPDGNKMSKSKGNVIDPDDIVERLGSDTLRLYLSFIGPYNETGSYPWDPNGVVGVRRFLERVWKIGSSELKETESTEITKLLHRTIKKVGEDYNRLKFNTAISAMMIYINGAEKDLPSKSSFLTFLKILSPCTPHITEELHSTLGQSGTIHDSIWPKYNEEYLTENTVTIAISVNGKVRSEIKVPIGTDQQTVEELAKTEVNKWLRDSEIKKVIYVEGKLINIVIS